MHFSKFILGYAAAVTAIDVALWTGPESCGGAGLVWRNVNPGTCCGISGTGKPVYNFGSWSAIPKDWKINMGIYYHSFCNNFGKDDNSNGRTDVCIFSGDVFPNVSGARYHFIDPKRSIDVCDAPDVSLETSTKCEPVPPNRVILMDGTVYDIDEVDKDVVDSLIGLSANGSTAAEISKLFSTLKATE